MYPFLNWNFTDWQQILVACKLTFIKVEIHINAAAGSEATGDILDNNMDG